MIEQKLEWMNRERGEVMDRTQKLLLLGAALLVVWFGFTLHDDWVHFNESLPMIMAANDLQDPSETKWLFFNVVMFRGALFLIPAFVMAFFAITSLVRDYSVPGERFSFLRRIFRKDHHKK